MIPRKYIRNIGLGKKLQRPTLIDFKRPLNIHQIFLLLLNFERLCKQCPHNG